MELQDIYFIAEIVAAIAVVGSLIFVGIQLRQSTAATVVGNSQAMVQVRTNLAVALATNSDLAALHQQGLYPDVRQTFVANPGQNQIGVWTMATFRSTEVWFLQWRDGHLSDELWQGNRETLKRYFSSHQSVTQFWTNNRPIFAPDFQLEVDKLAQEAAEDRRAWLEQLRKTDNPGATS